MITLQAVGEKRKPPREFAPQLDDGANRSRGQARFLLNEKCSLLSAGHPLAEGRRNVVQSVNRIDDLESGCDLSFERRWWRIQRVGWVILSLLLVGGVAGVFGHGPLSKATVHPPGSGLQVRYDRLARRETPSLLELRLEKAALASGQVRIRLNRALVERMQLKQIVPPPLAAEPLADGARFVFPTDPTRDSAFIIFTENPATPGIVDGVVTVEGAKPVSFRQFIYP